MFRAILLAATSTTSEEALAAYGGATKLDGLRVLDPFAGSGTTLVEAIKAGAAVVGIDINPVATLVQRQALAAWDESELRAAFKAVEAQCRAEIDELHRDSEGRPVLYYFWTAVARCPTCHREVELFSNRIFARNAYTQRFPEAKATCPVCHAVVNVNLAKDEAINCKNCGTKSSFAGPVSGKTMTCDDGHRHCVLDALGEERPQYAMYAKLVLGHAGKSYEPIDEFDRRLYVEASERLKSSVGSRLVQPAGELTAGYNTVQAMRWGFRCWRDFFNDRQLYSLGLLASAVRDLDCPPPEREALAALFSGTLEFNNLFCSYKGEGTGAVRHMFSHHVLKPERTPLEAHPWGTPASSGSFSTLFESRLIRAHAYKRAPVDLVPTSPGKRARVIGLSAPLACELDTAKSAVVFTGNAAHSDLRDESIDLIVTDPPYMDNVHYSELADFFHAWLANIQPFALYPTVASTRTAGEVQDTTSDGFATSIESVWRECERVLKPSGLLAFTFHQAKLEGWIAILGALVRAGFVVSSMQPVKAEMSVAAPKHGAREPSTLDTIVICRKRGRSRVNIGDSPEAAAEWARLRLQAIAAGGVSFGSADVRSVVRGCVLSLMTRDRRLERDLASLTNAAEDLAEEMVVAFSNGV